MNQVDLHSGFEETPAAKKLRVAIVSSQNGFNGGERQMMLLADGLRNRGHELCILARKSGKPADRFAGLGFRVETFWGRGRSPRSLLAIRRVLSQFRPDVLHYNDSHSLVAAGVASLGLGVPLRVASRRVDFPIRSTRHYQSLADRVLCVSNAVRHACERAGIGAERLAVVHDGVEPDSLHARGADEIRKELGIGPDQVVLVSIGSLTDCKGHGYLLNAVAELLKRRTDIVLLCAGDGELRQALIDQTVSLGIESHVRFLGFRNDTANLIAAADMMVVASHSEGLCSSIIDAMMIGCPVVATDAGGIPDLLIGPQKQSNGWMVPVRSSEALAQAIEQAILHADERDVRKRRAMRHAMQNFTSDCMVEQTLKQYAEPVRHRLRKSG